MISGRNDTPMLRFNFHRRQDWWVSKIISMFTGPYTHVSVSFNTGDGWWTIDHPIGCDPWVGTEHEHAEWSKGEVDRIVISGARPSPTASATVDALLAKPPLNLWSMFRSLIFNRHPKPGQADTCVTRAVQLAYGFYLSKQDRAVLDAWATQCAYSPTKLRDVVSRFLDQQEVVDRALNR